MYEGTLIQEDGHNALINIGQLEGINLKNNKGDVIGNVEGLIKRGENSIVATAPADTQTSFVGLFIKQKNQQNETYALFIPTREAIQEDLTLIT